MPIKVTQFPFEIKPGRCYHITTECKEKFAAVFGYPKVEDITDLIDEDDEYYDGVEELEQVRWIAKRFQWVSNPRDNRNRMLILDQTFVNEQPHGFAINLVDDGGGMLYEVTSVLDVTNKFSPKWRTPWEPIEDTTHRHDTYKKEL